ncbi:MAG: hypothetical protein EON59_14205, partial [Alphaproteobacteria bacterium]
MNIKLMTGIAAAVLTTVAPGIAAAQDAHDRPALQLASNGLELRDVESGETDLIGFGTGQDDTVQFLGRALNEPSGSGMSEECGAGPLGTVDFGDLRAYFKAGEFVGWETTSGFHSKQGIHVGMTSDALMAANETANVATPVANVATADVSESAGPALNLAPDELTLV